MRLVQFGGLVAGGWLALASASSAQPAACANPDAIGTSRILVIDPHEHQRLGTMQYHETLPLKDHEVVITFDDGPLPPYTSRILDTLASQCVKATYFLVGEMAKAYPKLVRRIAAEGHTIGTHSQHHPFTFRHMSRDQIEMEVDGGIASVQAALGPGVKQAPFFRIPGLLRSPTVEDFLGSQGLMAWSADFPADDWKHISAQEVVKRALSRLEIHHKGILLLHDIHPNTAAALPVLLRDLKARGYHIVQVVPATPTLPKTPTTPDQWLMRPLPVPPVPDLLDVSAVGSIPGLPITTQNGASDHPFGKLLIPISTREEKPLRSRKHGRRHLRRGTAWPQGGQSARGEAESGVAALPAPNPDVFKPLMPSETAAEAAAEARAAENAVAHADVARIVAPKAVPLPAVRPGRPKPLPTVQPEPAEPLEIVPPAGATAPAKPTFGAGLLPALIAHLWNRS